MWSGLKDHHASKHSHIWYFSNISISIRFFLFLFVKLFSHSFGSFSTKTNQAKYLNMRRQKWVTLQIQPHFYTPKNLTFRGWPSSSWGVNTSTPTTSLFRLCVYIYTYGMDDIVPHITYNFYFYVLFRWDDTYFYPMFSVFISIWPIIIFHLI